MTLIRQILCRIGLHWWQHKNEALCWGASQKSKTCTRCGLTKKEATEWTL